MAEAKTIDLIVDQVINTEKGVVGKLAEILREYTLIFHTYFTYLLVNNRVY